MKTLGMGQNKKDPEKKDNKSIIPAVLRNDSQETSLGKALFISSVLHPVVIGLVWLLIKGLIILLMILGITLPMFERPQPKIKDIEFVLVNNPEQKPINPNTKLRSDRNSRAGGKHNPLKQISEPQPQIKRSTPQQQASAPKPRVTHKVVRQEQSSQSDTPIPPRPVPRQNIPSPKITKPNMFSFPAPSTKLSKTISPSGGPVTNAPIGTSSPDSSPSPIMSTGSGSGKGRSSSGYSTGGGNAGNPSPGNPNGRPGVDAIRQPDWGRYMSELQRRIKRNWDPPKGNESKRVIILFKIAKDGRLLSRRIKQSSSVPESDRAAIAAIELSAPFRALPPEYKESDIDIEFTFDYNVYSVGATRY